MKIIWLYLEHKVCVAGRIALDHVLKFTFCQLSTGWMDGFTCCGYWFYHRSRECSMAQTLPYALAAVM